MKIQVTKNLDNYQVKATLSNVDNTASAVLTTTGKTRWEAFDNLIKAKDSLKVWLDKIPTKLNDF